MVRKINVVDLNEINSHAENIEPIIEDVFQPVETLPDVSIQSIPEKPVVMKKKTMKRQLAHVVTN